jgi:hypothetical protein
MNRFEAVALFSIVSLGACLYLAWFHVARAFREKGDRETRDILIGCAMAACGLLAPMAMNVIPNPLPRALHVILIIAAILFLSFAANGAEKKAADDGETDAAPGAEIFAPRGSHGYLGACIVGFLGLILVFIR